MALFTGQGIHCVRGGRTVFRDLAFGLNGGDMLILTGHNGSGKSSLLRLMAGLLPAASGSVMWDGEAIGDDPERHNTRLHYVGHADAVKPAFSVTENLVFWASLHGHARNLDTLVSDALSKLGIDFLADTPARFLSAGQRRRVVLARILTSPARLWLLDEPAAALDSDAVATMETLMADHRRQGGIVVLSTHSPVTAQDTQTLDMTRFDRYTGIAA